jgi:hypothetical protein
VRTEVNKVLTRIDAVQQAVGSRTSPSASSASSTHLPPDPTTRREAQQKLDDIDRDFAQWASQFIKERDLKKLEVDRQTLEARAAELELSREYQPIFQQMVDAIRAALQAYNKRTDSTFKAELRDPPLNLYLNDQTNFDLGKVTFSNAAVWTVRFYSEKPATRDRPPYFQIDFQSEQSRSQFRLYITPPNLRIQTFGGGIVSAAKLAQTYPLDSRSESIRDIVQRLMETQISSLPAGQ